MGQSKPYNKIIGATAGFVGGLASATKDYTLGAQQILLLLSLYVHNGELNQADLHKFTGVERSANSRNIARLGPGQWNVNRSTGAKAFEQGLGLVEAYEEPTNRRFKMVRLTPQGRAMLENIADQVSPYFQ